VPLNVHGQGWRVHADKDVFIDGHNGLSSTTMSHVDGDTAHSRVGDQGKPPAADACPTASAPGCHPGCHPGVTVGAGAFSFAKVTSSEETSATSPQAIWNAATASADAVLDEPLTRGLAALPQVVGLGGPWDIVGCEPSADSGCYAASAFMAAQGRVPRLRVPEREPQVVEPGGADNELAIRNLRADASLGQDAVLKVEHLVNCLPSALNVVVLEWIDADADEQRKLGQWQRRHASDALGECHGVPTGAAGTGAAGPKSRGHRPGRAAAPAGPPVPVRAAPRPPSRC